MNMTAFFRLLHCALIGCLFSALHAQPSRVALGGEWHFALDPAQAGVEQEWFQPALPMDKWDKVKVPHSFSVDPRYHQFTGSAWYRKTFKATRSEGHRTFVRFEAVFYRAQVWLNGVLLGEHEGGYTPFEFDVSGTLVEDNCLVVYANNAWNRTTIPGAKTKVDYQSVNYAQMYPWMNYGGITREVSLITRPEIYLEKTKIEAVPDLTAKTARLSILVFVRNRSSRPWNGNDLRLAIYREGKKIPVDFKVAGGRVGAQSGATLRIEATLAAEHVRLWTFDSPVVYEAELTAGADVARSVFGIRSIEVRGTKLLLNGEPIALGGANRPVDAPGFGSIDPPEVFERDLRLMKSGGMEFSRIIHYPVSPQLLDWADRNGLLIIGEAGNWQMTPEQMEDPNMRAKFESQMKEMIERDWNHPSIIGWSLGNEYQSQTDEGKRWTKDMYAFTKALDPSRLVTFSSKIGNWVVGDNPIVKTAADEASHYVDFVSPTIYENHLETLQRIHALYPDKPIFICEFGLRADAVANEEERVTYLRRVVSAVRQCADFVIGASVWTFNDYASMFPGTNPNGYRPWGLVSPEREIRGMYLAAQAEFCPAVVSVRPRANGRDVVVKARDDFPRYTLRGYQLRVGEQTFMIDSLQPGEEVAFPLAGSAAGTVPKITLEKPNGFVVLNQEAR